MKSNFFKPTERTKEAEKLIEAIQKSNIDEVTSILAKDITLLDEFVVGVSIGRDKIFRGTTRQLIENNYYNYQDHKFTQLLKDFLANPPQPPPPAPKAPFPEIKHEQNSKPSKS